jgi:hypothetical protein
MRQHCHICGKKDYLNPFNSGMFLCDQCAEVEEVFAPSILRKAADRLYVDQKTRVRAHYYTALADWQERHFGQPVPKEKNKR